MHHYGVMWCKLAERPMKADENNVASHRKVRASISLPPGLHEEIERIARAKKVSIAWVVRDAVEKYLESEKPVLKK
jgi:predicted DNA-binding protein